MREQPGFNPRRVASRVPVLTTGLCSVPAPPSPFCWPGQFTPNSLPTSSPASKTSLKQATVKGMLLFGVFYKRTLGLVVIFK